LRCPGLSAGLGLSALMMAASFGMAALSWHLIEQPILAWRDRVTAPVSASEDIRAEAAHVDTVRGPHRSRASQTVAREGAPLDRDTA
jgi:peptidoglycan/LPS O-acetylase OafA/YrhL